MDTLHGLNPVEPIVLFQLIVFGILRKVEK